MYCTDTPGSLIGALWVTGNNYFIGVRMNKKALLAWSVETIRKGHWPTLHSGIKKPAPEGVVWRLIDGNFWILQSSRAKVFADEWEAAKASKQQARQNKCRGGLESRGLMSSTFRHAIGVKEQLSEIARKSREDLNNGN